MDHRIFKLPLLGWIFRTARAIPIAPAKEDPWLMEKAYISRRRCMRANWCASSRRAAHAHRRHQ
jgi:1-acyl-sn-glycerol-3-phosphate acyltransferase